jgi:hypothetical protein
MNTLALSIKQKYFDEIVAGTKKVETREIRPNTADRYFRYEKPGGGLYTMSEFFALPDEVADKELDNGITGTPIKYDALKLLTGAYSGKRPYIVVEVKGAELFLIEDKNNQVMFYDLNGVSYPMMQIEYKLGKILEKSDE